MNKNDAHVVQQVVEYHLKLNITNVTKSIHYHVPNDILIDSSSYFNCTLLFWITLIFTKKVTSIEKN